MTGIQPLYVLHLLHAIQYKLGVDGLLNLGLEYFQIARIISTMLQENMITETEGRLMLTEKGLKHLEELNKNLFPTNSENWLLPSEDNRIEKLDKFDIYLPVKKKNGD